MSIQIKKSIKDILLRRWIALVHTKPSTIEEYANPGSVGAYVTVVADAEDEKLFISKVRDTLENTMGFSIIEFEEIEILSPDRDLSSELVDSIQSLLPKFPIAFSPFYHYAE
jgi:hypothetical protein